MSVGDPGPYMSWEDDGDIWVPRTVPWREARGVALKGIQEYDHTLKYLGKSETRLLGFTRPCFCEEICELTIEDADDYDPALRDICRVPAWHFQEQETWRR